MEREGVSNDGQDDIAKGGEYDCRLGPSLPVFRENPVHDARVRTFYGFGATIIPALETTNVRSRSSQNRKGRLVAIGEYPCPVMAMSLELSLASAHVAAARRWSVSVIGSCELNITT